MFPNEPFDSHARSPADEADSWAKWESKSKTMEADLQARLRDRDDGKSRSNSKSRDLSMLTPLGIAILQFFTRDRS